MQPLRRSATVLLLSLTTTTAVAVLDAPEAPAPDPAARKAVAALLTGSATAAQAAVPEDFADTLGYEPVLDGDSITNPSGSCSSPVTLPRSFGTVCRQHDYGYDLLRYAEAVGGRLPAGAREALDDQFEQEALRSCGGGAARDHCLRWAHVAAAFVRANSWRQHESVPEPEDAWSVATAGAALLTLGSAASLLARGLGALTAGRRRVAGTREAVAA